MVIPNKEAFDNLFGPAKTADNKIITPDFNGQTVVAVAAKPTNQNIILRFDKGAMGGRNLDVYYTVINNGKALSYTQAPLALATVPKSVSVKQVNFYNAGNLIKTVKMSH